MHCFEMKNQNILWWGHRGWPLTLGASITSTAFWQIEYCLDPMTFNSHTNLTSMP